MQLQNLRFVLVRDVSIQWLRHDARFDNEFPGCSSGQQTRQTPETTPFLADACQCFHISDRMLEVYLEVLEIGVDRILGDVLGYCAVSWRALTS